MYSLNDVKEERIETDLLVIGGGLAGAFGAIKAKEAGTSAVDYAWIIIQWMSSGWIIP